MVIHKIKTNNYTYHVKSTVEHIPGVFRVEYQYYGNGNPGESVFYIAASCRTIAETMTWKLLKEYGECDHKCGRGECGNQNERCEPEITVPDDHV